MAISPEVLIRDLFINPTVAQNTSNIVSKGSVITFSYMGQTSHMIRDPNPMIIVSDIFNDMIRGVNLHYLTLPYMQAMIQNRNMAGNNNFSYKFIVNDKYIVDSFRSYKRIGISNLKMLDINFLKRLLGLSQTLNINELEQMRQQVRSMLEQEVNQPEAIPCSQQV